MKRKNKENLPKSSSKVLKQSSKKIEEEKSFLKNTTNTNAPKPPTHQAQSVDSAETRNKVCPHTESIASCRVNQIEVAPKSTSPLGDLKFILSDAEFAGDYFVCGQAFELPPIPGIVVRQSNFTFPLCSSQVNALTKLSRLSAHGHYSIEASSISFANPKWQASLASLLERIALRMGFDSQKCAVKLRRLELFTAGSGSFEESASFKEENDLATLLIQLPSIFTGGSLLCHSNEPPPLGIKQEFDFHQSGDASYEASFAAFDASLKYCLQEVKSGHRILLNYSIHSTENFSFAKQKRLVKETSLLLSQLDLKNNLAMLLDGDYRSEMTTTSKCIEDVFTHMDKNRFSVLRQANEMLSLDKQYRFFVAHLAYDIETDLTMGYG